MVKGACKWNVRPLRPHPREWLMPYACWCCGQSNSVSCSQQVVQRFEMTSPVSYSVNTALSLHCTLLCSWNGSTFFTRCLWKILFKLLFNSWLSCRHSYNWVSSIYSWWTFDCVAWKKTQTKKKQPWCAGSRFHISQCNRTAHIFPLSCMGPD